MSADPANKLDYSTPRPPDLEGPWPWRHLLVLCVAAALAALLLILFAWDFDQGRFSS